MKNIDSLLSKVLPISLAEQKELLEITKNDILKEIGKVLEFDQVVTDELKHIFIWYIPLRGGRRLLAQRHTPRGWLLFPCCCFSPCAGTEVHRHQRDPAAGKEMILHSPSLQKSV